MATSTINVVTTQDYCLLILIVWWLKLKLTENVYEEFGKNKEMFDFSNYSPKSKSYDNGNKLVVGKMKDETCGITTEDFADYQSWLWDKSYFNNYSEQLVCQGTKRLF